MKEIDANSRKRMIGVHPDLMRVVERAIEITEVPFRITEGLRTLARQRELLAKGASKTLKSRHLTGHAVDVVALEGDKISWEWPLYEKIAVAMKTAAKELGIPVEWGGDWKMRDGPHFQLPIKQYSGK